QKRIPPHDALVPVRDPKKRQHVNEQGHRQRPEKYVLILLRCCTPRFAQIFEAINENGYEQKQTKKTAVNRVRNVLISGIPHVPAPRSVGPGTNKPPFRKMIDSLIY